MEEAENIRRRLFDRLWESDSPEAWFRLQLRVAAAVLRAERARKHASKEERVELKLHMQMCRAYGDAIAWRCMHSHAIRHHAEAAFRPPHLGGIRDQLGRYFAYARTYLEIGLPVILPDLTNSLGLGDVVVVGDPEAPEIIEVKGDGALFSSGLVAYHQAMAEEAGVADPFEEPRVRGRTKRQLDQILSRTEYLRSDRGVIAGESTERVALQTSHTAEYLYSVVDDVVLEALANGTAVSRGGEHHVVFGISVADGEVSGFEAVKPHLEGMSVPVISRALRPYDELWWVAPPPSEWDVSREAAWALMDGEVLLYHGVDLRGLECTGEQEFDMVLDARDDPPTLRISGAGLDLATGPKFLWDVVYGFETIDSARARIVEVVSSVLEDPPEPNATT